MLVGVAVVAYGILCLLLYFLSRMGRPVPLLYFGPVTPPTPAVVQAQPVVVMGFPPAQAESKWFGRGRAATRGAAATSTTTTAGRGGGASFLSPTSSARAAEMPFTEGGETGVNPGENPFRAAVAAHPFKGEAGPAAAQGGAPVSTSARK